MSHSRRPDRGRGRVGWIPLHGSGGSQVVEPAIRRNPRHSQGGGPEASLSAPPDKTPSEGAQQPLLSTTREAGGQPPQLTGSVMPARASGAADLNASAASSLGWDWDSRSASTRAL